MSGPHQFKRRDLQKAQIAKGGYEQGVADTLKNFDIGENKLNAEPTILLKEHSLAALATGDPRLHFILEAILSIIGDPESLAIYKENN